MAKFETEKLRNLGIVGQGDAGKTSLVEAILYNTGMTDRLGKVDDGSSNMDFEPEETKRKITISSKLHHCEWNSHELHIVDTPGYTNFLHDTRNRGALALGEGHLKGAAQTAQARHPRDLPLVVFQGMNRGRGQKSGTAACFVFEDCLQ